MSYSARASELDELSREVKMSAREYFASSHMETLFPQLFEALWHYTLPCFPDSHAGRALLRRCSIGDEEIPCKNIFSRVPTDSGPGHNLYFDVTLFRHVLCHQHRRCVQKHNICWLGVHFAKWFVGKEIESFCLCGSPGWLETDPWPALQRGVFWDDDRHRQRLQHLHRQLHGISGKTPPSSRYMFSLNHDIVSKSETK